MRTLILALTLTPLALPATADEEPERVPPVAHAPTQNECGECHIAFPPGLLPAESWRKIMAGLAGHFGEDASLKPELAAEIETYLVNNAGEGDGRLLRITEQGWFRHEHDFPPARRQKPEIRFPSNCEGCHRDAAKGIFEDD